MEIRIFIIAIIVLLFETTTPQMQTGRCAFMIAIPREPKPDDLPELDFEGIPWSERPFIPAPERDDLCMDNYLPAGANAGTQVIYMEEEIEGEIAIAKINYDGDATPTIVVPIVSGVFSLLGPEIRRESDGWYIYITQRQDYETPGMQVYVFNVRIDGESLVGGISLQIVNIDDNPPIINAVEPCQVPELDAPGLTTCTYEVSDIDGLISIIAMTFQIDSDRDDDEVFFIQGDRIENVVSRMTMTVGLQKSLDFETNALHIFRVTAFDSLPNSHTVSLMVQVQNVEHRPPRWVEIFAVQQFDEKTEQTFSLRAIDGDTGINKYIYYDLFTDEEDEEYFDIKTIPDGRNATTLTVYPIDRDALEREIFQLTVVAYKYDNRSFETPSSIVIIINDVNDQIPEPLREVYRVAIDEETPQTLYFEEEFGFHDRDLGQHAQYKVHLESVYPPGAAEAFFIQPEIGYQRQTFIMGTTNHSMLDFEVPVFQHIELRVVATDLDKPEHIGRATVFIDLINWNDELPIFAHSTKTVSFDETAGRGHHVATLLAEDRDINDTVVHSLMGNARDYLYIDEATGEISVLVDDAFDYHRQNEILVQVRADDTLGEPYNTATSQLVILLNDINNTPPSLRLPRGSPQVEENVPENYVIIHNEQEITATDPDTTAELDFQIIWETSYATKQGRETPAVEFYGCIDIQTIYEDPSRKGNAIGRLVVKEIRYNVTIDYEEFEILYLTVRVVDKNTAIGQDYDELTFAITIIDMNDNPPLWANGSLEQNFRVREISASNTIIGTVLATDIDGPLYNQVRYTIFPRENTPDNLVKIDFYTGQIEVDLDGAIDADVPPRYNLYYRVIASDQCYEEDPEDCPPDPTYWETEGEITITIIDINNKNPEPQLDKFNTTVYIYENVTTGDTVVQLVASDLDRDDIYHTVTYQINYIVNPRLRDFFDVDAASGLVFVNYTGDEALDRDGDEPQHQMFFTLIDNFYSEGDGNRNQNSTEVLVVLLDVNDNAPELPVGLSWSISESLLQGVGLPDPIHAHDRDEPCTDNSRVTYELHTLELVNRDVEVSDLFTINTILHTDCCDSTTCEGWEWVGELETAKDLRGYWGTYLIGIRAFDHGDPQLKSEENYEIVIRPYNFHDPVFVFPQSGSTIRLSRERAVAGGLLALVDGEFLQPVTATDEDGLAAGVVTFDIAGDDEAVQYFQVQNNVENQGHLMLKQLFTENVREFQVVIRATDGGAEPGPRSAVAAAIVVFVPTQGDPVFEDNTASVGFTEFEEGLTQSYVLPEAVDDKNYLCEDDCYNIYYYILDGNDAGHFALDPNTNSLSLVRELDRSVSDTHTIRIAATNSLNPSIPLASSILTVTVTVREANPRPRFVRSLYTAGISTSDTINTYLLTVQATHTENVPITYMIDQESMVVDPSLTNVRDSAFALDENTGDLTLTMQPTASMQGMFQFDVSAEDPAGEKDTAEVKIYLISDLNRVFFRFINTVDELEANRAFVAETLTIAFEMTCNIDQIVPASYDTGVAQEDVTEVRTHFIRDDLPVNVEDIEHLRSDTLLLLSVQATLRHQNLTLSDLVTGASPAPDADSAQLTVYILAAIAAGFALMFIVLLLVFIIRTRILNRRLNALSMTKYGSQEAGLNRIGITAPGTNKHATEGSNPIWNEIIKAPDFDALSDTSDDSDLVGIENLPQFALAPGSSLGPPAIDDDDMFGEREGRVADHSNNFGFKSTPFNKEFGNKQFMF